MLVQVTLIQGTVRLLSEFYKIQCWELYVLDLGRRKDNYKKLLFVVLVHIVSLLDWALTVTYVKYLIFLITTFPYLNFVVAFSPTQYWEYIEFPTCRRTWTWMLMCGYVATNTSRIPKNWFPTVGFGILPALPHQSIPTFWTPLASGRACVQVCASPSLGCGLFFWGKLSTQS